jgi:hypothetical protein
MFDKLKLRHLLLAGIAALSLTPWVAKAGTPAKTYAEIGGWSVNYYPDSNSCSMIQTFGRGTTFYVTRRNGQYVFAFGNPVWAQRMEVGGRYKITMILDGHDRWTDVFEARRVNDTEIGLYFYDVSIDFLVSVMRRYRIELYVHSNGEHLTTLPLQNSAAAMMALADCANAADSNGGYRPPQQQQRRPAPAMPQV